MESKDTTGNMSGVEMNMKTIRLTSMENGLLITLCRIAQKNSLNSLMLEEINSVFDKIESDPRIKFAVLEGTDGLFCTGMDFSEFVAVKLDAEQSIREQSANYMKLLKRIANMPKIVISKVDGKVLAGGVGLVAASDIVIATERSHFRLTELLWGLLPANVMPYLIRRIGFQKTYFMTLTAQTLTAAEAHKCQLVDELSSNLEDSLGLIAGRLDRISVDVIGDLKNYCRKMWIINEEMETLASQELARLLAKPSIQSKIKAFVNSQQANGQSAGR